MHGQINNACACDITWTLLRHWTKHDIWLVLAWVRGRKHVKVPWGSWQFRSPSELKVREVLQKYRKGRTTCKNIVAVFVFPNREAELSAIFNWKQSRNSRFSTLITDILPCKEITWSNLTNGDAWFSGKNYCWIIKNDILHNTVINNTIFSSSWAFLKRPELQYHRIQLQ